MCGKGGGVWPLWIIACRSCQGLYWLLQKQPEVQASASYVFIISLWLLNFIDCSHCWGLCQLLQKQHEVQAFAIIAGMNTLWLLVRTACCRSIIAILVSAAIDAG